MRKVFMEILVKLSAKLDLAIRKLARTPGELELVISKKEDIINYNISLDHQWLRRLEHTRR